MYTHALFQGLASHEFVLSLATMFFSLFFHEVVRPSLTRCGSTAPYSHRPPNVNAHVISFKGFTNELAFVKYSRGAAVAHARWTRRTVQSPPT